MFFHVFPQLSSKRTKITKKQKKVNFETAILPGQKAIFPGQTAIFFLMVFDDFYHCGILLERCWGPKNTFCAALNSWQYFTCGLRCRK